MAIHALVPFDTVETLSQAATAALPVYRQTYDEHGTALAAQEERHKRETVNGKQAMDDRFALRDVAAKKLHDALATPDNLVVAAEDLHERLAAKRIARSATFLPATDPDGEARHADLRILAEQATEQRFARQLLHMDAAELAGEIRRAVDVAGDAPHRTPSLALLRALDEHVRTLPAGPERSALSAAVGGAWGVVESNWKALQDARAKVKQAHEDFSEMAERATSIKAGRPSAKVSYYKFRDEIRSKETA